MKSDRNLINRFISFMEWIKEGLLESKHLPRFDANVCVSKEEVNSTINYGVRPSRIILGTNGVNPSIVPITQSPFVGNSKEIVFCGSMDIRMNEDAVVYFISDIWPAIRKKMPLVHFTIVGRNPSRRIMKLNGSNGISVTGTVKDVIPYLKKAGIVIAPFRQGAGTKLKILEALALGKTIVSTSLGCQGIEVNHGQNILIANTQERFAEWVMKALKDIELRRCIGMNAVKLVTEKYNWKNICDNIVNSLCKMLKSTPEMQL